MFWMSKFPERTKRQAFYPFEFDLGRVCMRWMKDTIGQANPAAQKRAWLQQLQLRHPDHLNSSLFNALEKVDVERCWLHACNRGSLKIFACCAQLSIYLCRLTVERLIMVKYIQPQKLSANLVVFLPPPCGRTLSHYTRYMNEFVCIVFVDFVFGWLFLLFPSSVRNIVFNGGNGFLQFFLVHKYYSVFFWFIHWFGLFYFVSLRFSYYGSVLFSLHSQWFSIMSPARPLSLLHFLDFSSLCLFLRRGQPPPFCSGSCIFHNRMVCRASKTLQIGGVFNISNLTGDKDSQQNGNKIKLTIIYSKWKSREDYNDWAQRKKHPNHRTCKGFCYKMVLWSFQQSMLQLP